MSRTLIDALRQRLQLDTGQPVQIVETHISWVLLADTLAYKVKKPVRFGFVDFSTLALRKHFCEEELRLNTRLAASLYLRVAPICGSAQDPRIDGRGEPIDYAVCMRRFAPGALLSERVAAGSLLPEQLESFARRLTRFHDEAPIAPASGRSAADCVAAPVRELLHALRHHLDGARVNALESWVEAQVDALGETWARRQNEGRVRECHGDLHLANVVELDAEVTAFDCVEFDLALRQTDVLADVAFLTMDLKAHGRSDLAYRFLDAYLQCSGDYAGVPVLRFYEVYRALVRALVGRLRATSADPAAAAGPDYLACAENLIRSAGAARLLITHGVSGSGKSTLAQQLLGPAGAIRLRSDVERKRLFGLAALERSTGRGQIYTADANARTLDRLAQCARTALRAGHPVIVDAAFLRRAERNAFRALAADLQLPFTILCCTADEARLRERVALRATSGTDPSEADVEVLERQLERCEPLSGDERAFAIEVSTDQAVDIPSLNERWLGRILSGPRLPSVHRA